MLQAISIQRLNKVNEKHEKIHFICFLYCFFIIIKINFSIEFYCIRFKYYLKYFINL